MKVWTILGVVTLGLMLGAVASVAHAGDASSLGAADPRLVQAPSPRREIDLGEIRPYDSAKCRQAKEDVKVLDAMLNSPDFANIPTQAEYDLGYGWQREGGGTVSMSTGPTGRERTLETWGENSRQFREGEAANEKYNDFNRRAPRTYSKPKTPPLDSSLTDFRRRMDEYNNAPSYTYDTPGSEKTLEAVRAEDQDSKHKASDLRPHVGQVLSDSEPVAGT